MHQKNNPFPFLGYGLGLRPDYYEEILATKPDLDWFEITSENYMVPGGKPLYYLDKIRQDYPMVMHGVSLSLGSTEDIDKTYLRELKQLAKRVQPAWISDHLCWTGVNGFNMHDLLPLPYTQEAINHIVSRIAYVQEYLGQQIVIENVSSYLTYTQSEMTEWEFIHEICQRADCYLLLDVNNVYVSSVNHQFDPLNYLKSLPKQRITQIHLAGHSNHGNYIIDTHDAPIVPEVWDLYAQAIQLFGAVSTMVERDDHMPPLGELLDEVQKARKIAHNILTNDEVMA